MSNNVYGIDLGTNNFKVYSKASGKTMLEKNTIALNNKDEIYAYGDSAYAMYEKAPETINVVFPVVARGLYMFMLYDFYGTAGVVTDPEVLRNPENDI